MLSEVGGQFLGGGFHTVRGLAEALVPLFDRNAAGDCSPDSTLAALGRFRGPGRGG
ncbi:hypothetical protein [Streptomyces rochei]|uniref:hypothetical protein n=1 Tax=Streptomyces rochei TaxID=1928 RepID=UPI0013B8D3DA|nr:hypothetical protein [Streptomyces rochei]NEC73920.1 hypothetical protein [Streptomyces rochei]